MTLYAELVRPRVVRKGRLELSMTHLSFYEDRSKKRRCDGRYKDLKVPLDNVREVPILSPYQAQPTTAHSPPVVKPMCVLVHAHTLTHEPMFK